MNEKLPPPIMPDPSAAPPKPPPGSDSCLQRTVNFLGRPRQFRFGFTIETALQEIPRRPEPIA